MDGENCSNIEDDGLNCTRVMLQNHHRYTRQKLSSPDIFSFSSCNAEYNIPDAHSDISIDELMSNYPRSKKAVIKLQLLRIESGSNDGGNRGQSNFTFYSRIRRDKPNNATHSKLFLF